MATLDIIGQEIKPGDLILILAKNGKSRLECVKKLYPKSVDCFGAYQERSIKTLVVTVEQATNHRIENYKGHYTWGDPDMSGRRQQIGIDPIVKKAEILALTVERSRALKEEYGIED